MFVRTIIRKRVSSETNGKTNYENDRDHAKDRKTGRNQPSGRERNEFKDPAGRPAGGDDCTNAEKETFGLKKKQGKRKPQTTSNQFTGTEY